MIEQLIAEATECDFKVALETKKPKSWLKSVSAFSNVIGETLFLGFLMTGKQSACPTFKKMPKRSAASSRNVSHHYRSLY